MAKPSSQDWQSRSSGKFWIVDLMKLRPHKIGREGGREGGRSSILQQPKLIATARVALMFFLNQVAYPVPNPMLFDIKIFHYIASFSLLPPGLALGMSEPGGSPRYQAVLQTEL